jgi:DNA-binding TFAR19-related protein (PDSD5 family)
MAEDDDLAALRRKKMLEMMARKKEMEAQQASSQMLSSQIERKVDSAISWLFTPAALAYFNAMKQSNPELYARIRDILFNGDVMQNIDRLLTLIQMGRVPRGIINDVEIQQMERDILGIKSSISYKKRGEKERMDLGALFKGEKP